MLEVNGKVKATSFVGDGVIPQGGIIMWSGQVNTIPSGWALCNGSNGTPDLRGRFVVGYSGSGDYASVGNKGGSDSRTLSIANMPAHNHSGSIGARDTNHTHSGTTATQSHNHSHNMGVSGADDNNHTGNFNGVADSDAGHKGSRSTAIKVRIIRILLQLGTNPDHIHTH